MLTFGLMLTAFTLGAILEPAMAKLIRAASQRHKNAKLHKAITLVESSGYYLHFKPAPSTHTDEKAWL